MEFDDDFGVGNSAVRMLYSLLVGKFLYVVLTALSLILLARLLNPSGYGIYTIAVGFSALLGALRSTEDVRQTHIPLKAFSG